MRIGTLRGSAVSVTGAVALVIGALAGSATASSAHTASLTPTGHASINDRIQPVAGSSSYLVYERTALLANGRSTGPTQLLVRSSAGHITSLGAAPADSNVYSLVGSTLVTETGDNVQTVHWWDLTAGTHGSRALPRGDRLFSAAPSSFIFAGTPCHELSRETTDGHVTSLGTPFADGCTVVTADSTGIVVSGATASPKYMTFAQSGVYTSLDVGSSNRITCGSVDATYAGCVFTDIDVNPRGEALVPLSGAPAVTSTAKVGFGQTVVGSALFWFSDAAADYAPLHRLTADGTITSSTQPLGLGVVSALGKLVVPTTSNDALVAGTAVNSFKSLVGSTPSPVTAGAFAISGSRLVVNDDRHTSAPTGSISTVSSVLGVHGGHVTNTKSKVVATNAFWNEVAVDGKVTVHAVRHGSWEGNAIAWLKVKGARHDTTIKNVFVEPADGSFSGVYQNFTLVGTHLLYRSIDAKPGKYDRYFIYDDATGKTRQICGAAHPCSAFGGTPALQANAVSYLDDHEAVWRLDLTTGKRTKLAAAPKNQELQGGDVYASGPYVGWSVRAGHVVHHKELNAYVNTTTGHRVTLTKTIYGMSSAGVLLSSVRGQSSYADAIGLPATTFYLHPYGGATRLLLSSRRYLRGPQAGTDVVAWITPTGVLAAKPIG